MIQEISTDFDAQSLRACLGCFTTGVTVITARHDDKPVGLTVNSFTSLSLDPPLVLWSLRRHSGLFAPITNAAHFGVNILAADQTDLASRFARSEKSGLDDIDWQIGCTGLPLLPGAVATLECSLESVQDGGDHVVLIGRVRALCSTPKEPLVFVHGKYGRYQSFSDKAIRNGAAFAGFRSTAERSVGN